MTETTVRKYKHRSVDDVDFEDQRHVEGRLAEKGRMPMPDKRIAEFLILDTSEGRKRIWLSTDLEEAAKAAKIGDYMAITYLRTVKTSKGARTMKKFSTQVWSE